jgi:diguanylate cyclase (GGDEF)-like protein/PAS domain S-box-containing protein
MKFGISTTYLRFSFIAILGLVLVEIVADLLHVQRSQQEIEAIVRIYDGKINLVHDLHNLIHERIYTLNALLLEPDPFVVEALYPRLIELGNRFIQKRRQLEQATANREERAVLAALCAFGERSGPVIAHAVAVARDELPLAQKRALLAQILPLQRQMLVSSEALMRYYHLQVERRGKEALAADQRWLQQDALLGVVILLSIALIGRHVQRRISRKQGLLAEEIEEREKLERELESQVDERTRALKARTDQLYEAQRVARMGCWEWDLRSGRMEWSDEFYTILGLDKSSVAASQEAFIQRVHPDDRGQVEQAMHDAVDPGKTVDIDFRLCCGDDFQRVVQNRMVVEKRDEAGRPCYLLGTLQDITERKQVEEQLRLAASVFAHTGDGVMITDSDNRIIEVNEAFTGILGFSAEEVVGKDPSLFKSPRHRRSFYCSMWQSLQQDGQWQGEVWDKHKSGEIVPLWMTINAVYDERGNLRHYVALFRDITEVKRNEQTLWHIAHHDPLTGLPNRNLMHDRLRVAMSEAAREDRQVALLLIDLDGFKQVNDGLGHDAGDALLKQVALTLQECVRESDTVARYAGDEFIAIIKGMHEREDVGALAQKLIEALLRPHCLKESTVHVGASIGIALYPAHATDAEDLIAKADEAMYQAKRMGKGKSCFFGDDCEE